MKKDWSGKRRICRTGCYGPDTGSCKDMKRKATVSASSKTKSAKCIEKSDSGDATVSTSARKWCGAAIYKSKFQESWKQRWPFSTLPSSSNLPSSSS